MSMDMVRQRGKSMAQRRWRLLARALTRSPQVEDEISVRRFTSFGLMREKVVKSAVAEPCSTWYEYTAVVDHEIYNVLVRRVNKSFTANELIGFNNTGNVCVWPSEECLAYYLLKNRDLCRNRTVLELGGGMSCLAGIVTAKYCSPSSVTLTDGNVTSVDNVRCIVARNDLADFVNCGVVQWARSAEALRQAATRTACLQTWEAEAVNESCRADGLYDMILCADCLFFDDARLDLVETIYGWLADDGIALVMAPRRGSTFQKFAEAAVRRGFIARQSERYDDTIWSRHLNMLTYNLDYCSDLHFPVLLELTKQKKMPPG